MRSDIIIYLYIYRYISYLKKNLVKNICQTMISLVNDDVIVDRFLNCPQPMRQWCYIKKKNAIIRNISKDQLYEEKW